MIPKKAKQKVPLEKEIQKEILNYFEKCGIFYFRNNTMGAFDATRGCYRKQPKHSAVGAGDIFILYNGLFISVEVKRPKLGKVSPDQEKFMEKVKASGGHAVVLTSLEEAAELISDLKRS